MKSLLALLVFALVVPPGMEAQAPELAVGARVRVTSPQHRFNRDVATVTELRGDSIVLTSKMGTRAVALSNVTELHVSTGTRNQVMRNGLIGLGLGSLIGIAAGMAAESDCSDTSFCVEPAGGAFIAGGAVAVGGMGLVVGAITGLFTRGDRWVSATPPARATVGITRTGASIGFTRAF